MSAWHGIYADVLRQRFSGLVAYGVVLTGDRDAARELAQRAMETVFARARAPRGVAAAERAVRREMVRLSLVPDPVAGSGDGARPNAAPVEDAEGHREIRSWLASLNPHERAAVVLQSLDGLDEEGARRALGKKAPLQDHTLPEAHANEVRAFYRDEAARYASPARGANGAIDSSRGPRRKALARSGLVAGAVALVAGALGFGAAHAIDVATVAAPVPSASATPSPTMLTVPWDPAADIVAVMGSLRVPACGEEWAPAPEAVNGITPVVELQPDYYDPDRRSLGMNFRADYGDGEPTGLLYIPGILVVTRDGVVVHTQDIGEYPLESWMVDYLDPTQRNQYMMAIDGSSLCDAREAWREQFGDTDWESLTEEEREEYDRDTSEFYEEWSVTPPGEYHIYAVMPLIFGEQAALAGALVSEGLPHGLSQIYWGLGSTELASDPRLAPYCSSLDDGSGFYDMECTPPPEVLKEVLTRDIDPATVVDVPPGIGISAPLVITVAEPA